MPAPQLALGSSCPCGNLRAYAECCGRFHAGEVPDTAPQLMRSRYSAYVLRLTDYLLATWHPDTRPDVLALPPPEELRWVGLDIRSQRQNTEIALLIRSSDLSRRATTQIETALREAAWHVQLRDGGQLVWHAPEGSGLPDATTEPDASAPLRLMLQLLGPLAPDHLL